MENTPELKLEDARVIEVEKNSAKRFEVFQNELQSFNNTLASTLQKWIQIAQKMPDAEELKLASQKLSIIFSALADSKSNIAILDDLSRPLALLLPVEHKKDTSASSTVATPSPTSSLKLKLPTSIMELNLPKTELMRLATVYELIETEADYVRDLQIMSVVNPVNLVP
jgi:hypothetical protein